MPSLSSGPRCSDGTSHPTCLHRAEVPDLVAANQQAAGLPFLTGHDADRERASRGRVLAAPGQVRHDGGWPTWDLDAYHFLDGPPPPEVNPSLWRQAQLMAKHGLFKVSDRIWQVRGFDLANISLVEGRTGWIVIDALTTRETAAAARVITGSCCDPCVG